MTWLVNYGSLLCEHQGALKDHPPHPDSCLQPAFAFEPQCQAFKAGNFPLLCSYVPRTSITAVNSLSKPCPEINTTGTHTVQHVNGNAPPSPRDSPPYGAAALHHPELSSPPGEPPSPHRSWATRAGRVGWVLRGQRGWEPQEPGVHNAPCLHSDRRWRSTASVPQLRVPGRRDDSRHSLLRLHLSLNAYWGYVFSRPPRWCQTYFSSSSKTTVRAVWRDKMWFLLRDDMPQPCF